MATNKAGKKVVISMRVSKFNIPPIQKVHVVGKGAPVSIKTAGKTVHVILPKQYVTIAVKERIVEILIVKRTELRLIPQDILIPIISREVKKIKLEGIPIKINLAIAT